VIRSEDFGHLRNQEAALSSHKELFSNDEQAENPNIQKFQGIDEAENVFSIRNFLSFLFTSDMY
jgi:hypothetical protein